MKITIYLLLIFTSWLAKAEFNDALIAYEDKKYTQAFEEFKRLAQLGNKRAQFNLAVMYLKGQAVSKDPYKAYAWGKLSEHDKRPEFSQVADSLAKTFSNDELKQAEKVYHLINDQYGEDQIYTSLSPLLYQPASSHEPQYTINPISRKAPRYPKDAMNKGIQGWATVGFEIYPDGSARNPYVIESFPDGVFDETSIDIIQYFKFEVSFAPRVEAYEVDAKQTIQYELNFASSLSKRLKTIYLDRLNQLKDLAEKGSGQAQYLYAIAGSSHILNEDNKLSASSENEWLLKAAQNGNTNAQYQLGRNILRGKGCQVEKQKGIDWIVYAAEQGHSKSARMTYSLLSKNKAHNKTNKPAVFWLKQSSDNGDIDAHLTYAEFLVSQPSASADDIEKARSLLVDFSKHRDKTYDWYRVSSLIYQQQGKPKKANSHLKKANKLAKKLGWRV